MSIGRIGAPHGIKGEIKVQSLTDFPERFNAGAIVWIGGAARRIERGRAQGRNVVLKLEGVETRDGAEALRGQEMLIPEPVPLREEGVYYQHDIIGLKVEDAEGTVLGKVADVLGTGANDVYVVRGPRGEILLPAVEDVVREIDVPGGRMVVELLPGLEFASTARKVKKQRPPQAEDGSGYVT